MWYVGVSAAGHFTVDGYGNFLAPLLPLLAPKLGLSLVAVGGLASILGVSSSLIQPLFGFWADRVGVELGELAEAARPRLLVAEDPAGAVAGGAAPGVGEFGGGSGLSPPPPLSR